jgi:hypothetical protein
MSMPPPTFTFRLRRIDAGSGTVLVERTLDFQALELLYDKGSNRVIAFGTGTTATFDAGTLTEMARIDEAFSGGALDPDLPHLYVVKGRLLPGGGVISAIQQRDSRSLALLAEGELPTTSGAVGLIVGPRVTPPGAISSEISGRHVRLAWTPTQPSEFRTGFVVEVGSAAGRSDLALFRLGRDEVSLDATDVPPGNYYVRVRAVNGTGAGASSADILVMVQ